MHRSRWVRTGLVAVLCASVGAAGGIASSTAAKGPKARRAAHARSSTGTDRHRGLGPHGFPVHAAAVVLDRAGTAFITATEDNGTVDSAPSGDQLTIKEAADGVTYKTVTLTIPSGATIYRNGSTAALSDLQAGDHVHVTQSSDGTIVLAGNRAFAPRGRHGWRDGGPGPDGPPPGGPPPDAGP